MASSSFPDGMLTWATTACMALSSPRTTTPRIPSTGEKVRGRRALDRRSTLVAEEDHAAAEGPGLEEPEIDPAVRGPEQGRAPSDDHRVDVEPELVDEVVAHERRGEVGP